MEQIRFKLILGSGSPRRKELMAATFLPFEIHTSDKEEVTELINPSDIAQDLALMKAQDVYHTLASDQNFVIGADTIVVLDDEVLGKPKNPEDARNMLQRLSGRQHTVITGVAFVTGHRVHTFYEKTWVEFSSIDDDLLDLYLATGDSLDKAGAYGIQGVGLGFIHKVEGSYSNVVGLPVDKLLLELKAFFHREHDRDGLWRKHFV